MNSRETRSRSARWAAVAVLVAAMTPLSGCLSALIPVDVQPTPTASAHVESEPTQEPDAGGEVPSTMTFEDGLQLDPTAYIEWGDGLIADDGWVVESPDDGAGGWAYRTVDGACTATFWQGTLDGLETTGDDSASSDALIAHIVGSDVATIAAAATDGALSYQSHDNPVADSRALTGQEGTRTWIIQARAFAQPGIGLYVIIDCASGDAGAVAEEVVSKNAIIITD